jgi:hypothetical protein
VVARILRTVSLCICLVAIASFVGFAVEQSKAGSDRQQTEVNAASPVTASDRVSPPGKGKSGLRKAIDDAFAKVASPFSGLTKQISSPWPAHIANTLLALLVYGFGLGLLARVVRFGD